MNPNRGYIPQGENRGTDLIKYTGPIPECFVADDCDTDVTQLTFIIQQLLEAYCNEDNSVLSEIEFTCMVESNNTIPIPDDITIASLFTFYRDHFCSIYEKIDDIEENINTIEGDVNTIEGNITAIQGNITTIEGDITTIQNDIADLQDTVSDLSTSITNLENQLNLQIQINTYQQDKIDYILEHLYDCCDGGEAPPSGLTLSFEGTTFTYCYRQPDNSKGKLEIKNMNIVYSGDILSVEGISILDIELSSQYKLWAVKQLPSEDFTYIDDAPYTTIQSTLYTIPEAITSSLKSGATGTISIYVKFTDTNGLPHTVKISAPLNYWDSNNTDVQDNVCYDVETTYS